MTSRCIFYLFFCMEITPTPASSVWVSKLFFPEKAPHTSSTPALHWWKRGASEPFIYFPLEKKGVLVMLTWVNYRNLSGTVELVFVPLTTPTKSQHVCCEDALLDTWQLL